MNSSTRLYARLGEIPQDPEDPESLEDLIVCAFGAFERYYVCWKNKAGEYRQGVFERPMRGPLYSLHHKTDMTCRKTSKNGSSRPMEHHEIMLPCKSFSGRGDEYFASDKNGKLENKEPELKKPPPVPEVSPKDDKPALKRSRTISIFRPPPDPALKTPTPMVDTPTVETSKRRSSNVSQMSSRPPSAIFSRPNSDSIMQSTSPVAATASTPGTSRRSSFISSNSRSQSASSLYRTPTEAAQRAHSPDAESALLEVESPAPAPSRLIRRSTRPLSMSFNSGSFPRIVEGKTYSPQPEPDDAHHCSCCRHNTANKPRYADASVQTDPEPLRIDTSTDTTSHTAYSNYSSAFDYETPITDDLLPPLQNPVLMGGMSSYFGRPGYQLGDSLMSSYHYFDRPIYEYQEDSVYGEEWGVAVSGK